MGTMITHAALLGVCTSFEGFGAWPACRGARQQLQAATSGVAGRAHGTQSLGTAAGQHAQDSRAAVVSVVDRLHECGNLDGAAVAALGRILWLPLLRRLQVFSFCGRTLAPERLRDGELEAQHSFGSSFTGEAVQFLTL